MTRTDPKHGERGQILVLAAVGFIALCGIAALAIDLSFVYATERHEQAVTDAASLAGGQQLQIAGSRQVTATEYQNARQEAMQNLVDQLSPGASLPTCPLSADVIRCAIPGTDYQVSIEAPSPLCSSLPGCDPSHSVLVSLTKVNVGLFFANLFGQHNWNVSRASVAGLEWGAQYAVVTLRGTQPKRGVGDLNQGDITVTGGSIVNVWGDVGANTNMIYSGTNSTMNLQPSYWLDHYDTYQGWTGSPNGRIIPTVIPDPIYTIPLETTGSPPTYTRSNGNPNAEATASSCTADIAAVMADSGYASAITAALTSPPVDFRSTGGNTYCYKPGIYQYDVIGANAPKAGHVLTLLEPGVYFFDNGLSMGGPMIGGWAPAPTPGVSLVFTEGSLCTTNSCGYAGNTSPLTALNMGTCIDSTAVYCPTGSIAAPALEADGTTPVQVTFTGPPVVTVPESLIVTKDPACLPVTAIEPSTCDPNNKNHIVNLPGGGNLFIAGVQYAPTDQISIKGSSGSTGRVGQLYAWTVTFDGNSTLNEVFPGGAGNGILRLDQACTGAGPTGVGDPVCYP